MPAGQKLRAASLSSCHNQDSPSYAAFCAILEWREAEVVTTNSGASAPEQGFVEFFTG
jgi:hypothetical protein